MCTQMEQNASMFYKCTCERTSKALLAKGRQHFACAHDVSESAESMEQPSSNNQAHRIYSCGGQGIKMLDVFIRQQINTKKGGIYLC